jgi:hypothetical protein
MKAYRYPTQRELKNITIQSYFILCRMRTGCSPERK